ncbi:hypothetical protein LRS10_17150 [Phenylobacterium sp. J426]|uniref:hypothetical protein n=1 Tax=Phenylobacterium sp. J426 TaxID=2898439 RepID=UPI002150D0BD|nr:hypothetical protein [Phenylobacterium sp. J426]MCR5875738.1 hypothetical protein [Phenylobacterium sp. J426]
MNAPRPLFENARRVARLLATCGAASLLSACVANPFVDAKVDPNSPVAAEVAKVANARQDYPSFRDIPAVPKDLRPVGLYGREAERVKAAGAELIRATEPDTWTLQASESFAERARRDAGPELPATATQDSDAFARGLRERATPPPPR